MSVYFFLAPSLGMVKIGFAETPVSRLVKASTDSPVPLELRAVIDGGVEDERALHARFARYRDRGEWFHVDGALRDFIDTLEQFQHVRSPRKQLAGPLGRWISENEMTIADFAARVGSTGSTISRVCAGKQNPSAALTMAIFLGTNKQVTPNDLFGFAA